MNLSIESRMFGGHAGRGSRSEDSLIRALACEVSACEQLVVNPLVLAKRI